MAKDFGDQLRHAREARGFTLEDLMDRTKIPVSALRAIEDEAFDRLPAGIFRRAYLRAFANEVGLDADDCVAWYTAQWEPPPAPEPQPRLATWTDARLRALLAVLVVIGAFAAWPLMGMLWRLADNMSTPQTTTSPARSREFSTPPAPTAVASAPAGPSAMPAPSAISDVTRPLRLQLTVINSVWISAEADDRRVVRRLFAPGEAVTIDAARSIVLSLGAAGSVTYTINGSIGRMLGRTGQPVTVRITPDTYRSMLASSLMSRR